MKYTTLDDINVLESLISIKTDKINHLTKQVEDIRSRYNTMTDSQLAEAIRDVQGMKKGIAEARTWIKNAKETVRKFFAPASIAM